MTHTYARPSDFPIDAEIEQERTVRYGCYSLAAGIEAMMDDDDFYIWSRSIPGTKRTLTAARFGAEDGATGALFAPELLFVPGTLQYQEYVTAYRAAQR